MAFTFVLKFLLLALPLSCLAAPNSVNCASKVKESVDPPRGWIQGNPAPADHILELRLALPQAQFYALETHLYEISDPFHERYGQHLTKEQVEDLVAPHPESLAIVSDWLASHGLTEDNLARSPAKDWIIVRVPVSKAEEMLGTKYHVWTHEKSGDSAIRTLTYNLPEDVHEHIELIQPTTMFARLKGHKTTFHWSKPVQQTSASPDVSTGEKITLPGGITVDASCNTTITISCLKELYNAVGFKPSATNGNKIGLTGYLGQFANIADLQSFYADQVPAAVNTSFTFVSVNGGQNPQNITDAGGEANLDVQFALGLSFPTPGTFWSTAGMPPFIPDIGTPTDSNEPYTTWLDFILSHPNPPQTISTSYGDDEQTVPRSFATRVCNGFAQLGARGVSLMFSSGDGGVGDGDPNPATQQCFTNDGRNITQFIPGFPASCPFVTAVGGTVFIPEIAVPFSGGGFSNFFPRPSYQDKAVTTFLNKLPKGTFAGLFNPNGRGIPDVSAQSDFFRIFFEGQPGLIGGTLPPLGFLNPFLYSTGQAGLTDITVGNNPGCGTEGFNATTGWDPVTGLGTPNFGKLKDLVLH